MRGRAEWIAAGWVGYAVLGVAAWERVRLLRPEISHDRLEASDLRFLVPSLGPQTRKADGEVDEQVDEMAGQGRGCSSSRRHQEFGIAIVCGLRWQQTLAGSRSTLQSPGEAMLAVGLVRSS